MRAVLFHEFGAPLEVSTVPDPDPPPDGVVIQVEATGICRSDWHGWQGHDPDITTLPHVPGHELAGQVVASGKDVTKWTLGGRVTTPFVCGCGDCVPCRRGDHQVCDHQTQPGFTHWGSFAEYVVVRHADVNLVALPEEVDSISAAALGCRFATAFRAVVDQGKVQPGQWVAVHGCGGVGLSAIQIAHVHEAKVIAVDIDPLTLDRAQRLGAVAAIDPRTTPDVGAAIHELTRGGADLSLDCLGATVTAANSIASVRKNGRHVQVGLLAGEDFHPRLPMELVISREISVIGSHGMPAHHYPRMLSLIQDGYLDPELLISRCVDLEDTPAELEALPGKSNQGMVMIAFGE